MPQSEVRRIAALVNRRPYPQRVLPALPALGWVAIAIVGIGGALPLGRHLITAVALAFGVNLAYMEQRIESGEAFRECCLDQDLPTSERDRCCQQHALTWQRVESFERHSAARFDGRLSAVRDSWVIWATNA